jgi:hypothetical protein
LFAFTADAAFAQSAYPSIFHDKAARIYRIESIP